MPASRRLIASALLATLMLGSPSLAQDAAPNGSLTRQETVRPTSPSAESQALPPVSQPQSGETPPASPSVYIPLDAQGNAAPATSQVQPQAGPMGGERPATLPHNLSPWGMFMAADIVVKAVMLGLAFASFVTWTVWFAKSVEIAAAKTAAHRVMRVLMKAGSLHEAASAQNTRGFGRRLIRAAAHEVGRSEGLPPDGIKDRVLASLVRTEAAAGRRMTRGMGVLATIGATAPFVGLFGTVWGIMNSFIGISEAQTTNLAVVAPGIAEALLATAIGLVAAIPAVVIYNFFARSISGYKALLSDASAEIMKHVSRDLDRHGHMRHLMAAE